MTKRPIRKFVAGQDAGVPVELPVFVIQEGIHADRVHGGQSRLQGSKAVEVDLCVNDVHPVLQGTNSTAARSSAGALLWRGHSQNWFRLPA